VPIYDNLSGFDSGNATIIGPSGVNDFVQGYQFTAMISGFVGSIEAPVGWWGAPGAVDVTFGLYADAAGELGALLEKINVVATAYGGNPNVETALASGATHLLSGRDYWLLAESDEFSGWNLHHAGDSLKRAISRDGGATFEYAFGPLQFLKGNTSAFRVNAAEIPAPATHLLFLFGLAAVFSRHRLSSLK
jgi:hypothetical protein